MSIKNKFHTLDKKEFDEYLNKLKESEGTLIFLSYFDKSFFYYQSNEIDQLLLSLNKAQWKFDNLINSFSYFAKNQIIQSYLIEEIESTNKIENICCTKHDIFSIIKEEKLKDALYSLDEKFRTIKNGKGIAYTIPLSSVIGVAIYAFLSNNKDALKGEN